MSTKIEWTDETWNPISGCSKVSAGCKNCYAERLFPRPYPGRAFTDVRTHPDRLDAPLRWRKPRRIFVNSMSDLFHEDVPDEFINQVFAVMMLCPRHDFQILTKRPDNMRRWFTIGRSIEEKGFRRVAPIDVIVSVTADRILSGWQSKRSEAVGFTWPLGNVWLGVSVEDQATADERIPLLLDTPAAIRFVSYEPALGPINLTDVGDDGWAYPVNALTGQADAPKFLVDRLSGPKVDWVIAGGESGPHARPAHPDWFRSARDQCAAAGVAFFFKQWGEFSPGGVPCYSHQLTQVEQPGDPLATWTMARVGKKAAGRLLDGREHSEYPA